ncbi:hypothetical protein BOTBODRAFT_498642 [Botryobasidium botryosum FD-172 SS1]|uniref:Uncharacterized protein n=1 Tax=Botryobasidium botryosum (strain FD-172 SS1) TaxID=930990 RepID=A0A067MEY5_BOTB1|nr:hypothetical protein BOTBODRAFT_498642 [Botryobasidium botryosum FD-172 SS1]
MIPCTCAIGFLDIQIRCGDINRSPATRRVLGEPEEKSDQNASTVSVKVRWFLPNSLSLVYIRTAIGTARGSAFLYSSEIISPPHPSSLHYTRCT